MPDIDLRTLTYSREEVDAFNSAETQRVNTQLDTKIDTAEAGSPSGVSTLDPTGKVSLIELPISTLVESDDDTNSTTLITPERLHYQIDTKTVSNTQIGAANGVTPLGADSLVPVSYLPAIPSHNTFVVTTLQEMYDLPLTTTVTEGDRCIVTAEPTDTNGDKNGEYVADVTNPASNEWSKLPNLSSVTSVNGQTGIVNLTSVTESASNAVDIAALDLRVGTNESDIASTVTAVGLNTTAITTKANQSALDTTNATVSGHTTSIGALQTADIALDDRVTVLETHLDTTHSLVLHAESNVSSQQPLSVDTPLQLTYGTAQLTVSDPVMIDASGNLTFNQAGSYIIGFRIQYGRTGSSGASHMAFRSLVDNVPAGNTAASIIDNANVLLPWSGTYVFNVTNNQAGTDVGFVLVPEGKDASNPENHIKEAYVTQVVKEGTTESSNVVTLSKGTYKYFCPLNKTPQYTLVVK